jgi:hypothetical protein
MNMGVDQHDVSLTFVYSRIKKYYLTTKCLARQSPNQSSEYLPQRRKGRKVRR